MISRIQKSGRCLQRESVRREIRRRRVEIVDVECARRLGGFDGPAGSADCSGWGVAMPRFCDLAGYAENDLRMGAVEIVV